MPYEEVETCVQLFSNTRDSPKSASCTIRSFMSAPNFVLQLLMSFPESRTGLHHAF